MNSQQAAEAESASAIDHTFGKKSVFHLDEFKSRELLISHGIKPENLTKGFTFRKILRLDEKALNESILDQCNDLEKKHWKAIINKYKTNPYPDRHKLICDSIHGQIHMHPLIIKIIDTPQFQRLRSITQLSVNKCVYPSATHSRFEHSIGTGYLAGYMMRHLKMSQQELKITLADELCVEIAGLCHDLGHGPFSHTFEEVVERLGIKDWQHEKATLSLFDRMLDENKLVDEFNSYGLFENEIQLIKDLIFNIKDKTKSYEENLKTLKSLQNIGLDKSFLFEIVSNSRNNIDVDKFDYFRRDSYQLGSNVNFDHMRYILSSKVMKPNGSDLNQICVRDNEIHNLYELFHVRERLTRHAYKHKVVNCINEMLVDAFVKADKYYKFSDIIKTNDIEAYEKLNDCIFYQMLYSNDENLQESKKIVELIVKRKLYKYINSVVLPTNNTQTKDQIKESFLSYVSKKYDNIQSEDIFIAAVKFNYGSGNKNPLENVRFFSKYSEDKCFAIEKSRVSNMLLTVFQDEEVRLYYKKSYNNIEEYDNNYENLAKDSTIINNLFKAFSDWCQESKFGRPILCYESD